MELIQVDEGGIEKPYHDPSSIAFQVISPFSGDYDSPNDIPVCGNSGCEILESFFESDDLTILKKNIQDEIDWLYKEAERLQKEQIDNYIRIAKFKSVMKDVMSTKDLETLTKDLIRTKVYG